jgi:hypothetical protein
MDGEQFTKDGVKPTNVNQGVLQMPIPITTRHWNGKVRL